MSASEKLNLEINGKDNASGAVNKVKSALSGMASVAGGILGADLFRSLASGISDMVSSGMELRTMKTNFASVADSLDMNFTKALLGAREATKGMVTDSQIFTAGTKMMAMGLVTTEDELSSMTGMAVQLGQAMGQDASGALSDFTAMLANKSIPRLDNFGISSSKVRERIAELTAAGYDADEAFNMAVMEQGQVAMEALGDQALTLKGQWAKVTTVFENSKEQFGGIVLGALSGPLESFADFLTEHAGEIGEFMDLLGEHFANFGQAAEVLFTLLSGGSDFTGFMKLFPPELREMAAEIYPMLTGIAETAGEIVTALMSGDFSGAASGLSDLLSGLAEVLSTALPELIPMGMEIVMTLVMGILEALPGLVQGAAEIIVALANGLAQSLALLIPAVMEIIPQIIVTLIENLPLLIEGAINLILAIVMGIAEALPILAESIPTIITTIIDTLLLALPMLIEAAATIIVALVEGLTAALPVLIEYVPVLVETIIDVIIELLPIIAEAAVEIVMALIEGIGTVLPTLGESAGELIQVLVDGITELIPSLLTAGEAMVTGLWEGISAKAGWLKEQFLGMVTGLIDGVKGALGIESPSKVFADQIGKWIPAGIAVGIKANAELPQKELDDLNMGLNNNLSLSAMGGGGGGGTVNNINITVNSSAADAKAVAQEVAYMLSGQRVHLRAA